MNESGFLVVDKPSGPTSHDIVALARRATHIKKIGHAGTLDPLATGVLVLALGRATRLIRYVQDFDKEYQTTVCFGVATTTLDAGGDEVSRSAMRITAPQLEETLARFRGVIEQVPPMFSALKLEGQRLHEIARAGQEVDRRPRQIHIHEIEVTSFLPGDFPEVGLRVVCSKGTYIRTLADDIAIALGGRAHVRALRRTRVGAFSLDSAISPEGWSNWHEALAPLEAATVGMDRVTLSDAESLGVRNGRPLASVGPEGPLAILDRDGQLLAIYRRMGVEARAEVVLA